MNELSVPWSDIDEQNTKEALMDLFRLQGYKWTEKQLNENSILFTKEIATRGIPVRAVLGGIHKLKAEKLVRIDLHDILEASKEKVEPIEMEREDCDVCFGSGYVSMKDENSYEFALRCRCKNGNHPSKKDLRLWNGENEQECGFVTKTIGDQTVKVPRVLRLRFPLPGKK